MRHVSRTDVLGVLVDTMADTVAHDDAELMELIAHRNRPNVLRARKQHGCMACGAPVGVGELVWPLHIGGDPRRTWVHVRCAVERLGTPLVPPPCKHYVGKGFCVFGDRCFFDHPDDVQPVDGPTPFVEPGNTRADREERAQRQPRGASTAAANGAASDEPGARISRYRMRARVRNHHRASMLRRWVLERYGLERVAAGAGVLEVAGGKGELSFQFAKVNGIRATNVDPRRGRLDKYRKVLAAGFYTRNRAFEHVDVRVPARASSLPADGEPGLVRAFFEMPQLRARTRAGARAAAEEPAAAEAWMPVFARDEDAWAREQSRARSHRWTRRGLVRVPGAADAGADAAAGAGANGAGGFGDDTCPECACACDACEDEGGGGHGADDADEDDEADGTIDAAALVDSLDDARAILSEVSIVVSMHGDAAVDHALEFALQRGLPFALVPCCVYQHLNPWRPDVRSYEQLLQHLEARAREAGVEVGRTTLLFEGKNQLIYSL